MVAASTSVYFVHRAKMRRISASAARTEASGL